MGPGGILLNQAHSFCACGGTAAGGQATDIPKTQNTRDISEGVQPVEAAVALLLASFKSNGEITVAMDLSSPPMTFLAEDNSTPIAVNPDLARVVAKKLGMKSVLETPEYKESLEHRGLGESAITDATIRQCPGARQRPNGPVRPGSLFPCRGVLSVGWNERSPSNQQRKKTTNPYTTNTGQPHHVPVWSELSLRLCYEQHPHGT